MKKGQRETRRFFFIKQTKILEQKEQEAMRKKEKKVTEIDKAIEDMRKVGIWESENKRDGEIKNQKKRN